MTANATSKGLEIDVVAAFRRAKGGLDLKRNRPAAVLGVSHAE